MSQKKSTKLWDKGKQTDQRVEEFTVGTDRDLDLHLAKFDILGSLAHCKMLKSINLLSDKEYDDISTELKNLYQMASRGELTIAENVEDIHSQVELALTEKLGETGKKIHAGRSRNDQVMLDIKLYLRDRLNILIVATAELFNTLIGLSEQHKDVLLPGYTHLQVAMPSSFGLWFGAYAESLVDDLIQLNTAFKIINKNPLGSAAGFGSSLPLDRALTTNLLGFFDLDYNSVYAQMNRGKTERIVANTYSQLAATLSKLAMDITLYLSQNFGFISFPEEVTTGSSIMPHKKNPDVFELIRARCNRIVSIPVEINLITVNLPSGYHRDFQELKRNIIPAGIELTECVEVINQMLKLIEVNRHILKDEKYKYLFSVDAVNDLVREGVSFREAYKKIGHQIDSGRFKAVQTADHSHEGSIGNLCNDKIRQRKNKVMEKFNYSEIERALRKLVA